MRARAGRRLDFNYFIRALIDVPRTAAISAEPLAATFYASSAAALPSWGFICQ